MSLGADRVREYFARFTGPGRPSLAVPEWGKDGVPLVLYWSPYTLNDQFRIVGPDPRLASPRLAAEIIVAKAEDRDGKRLFEDEHALLLAEKCDRALVERIAKEIMSAASIHEWAAALRQDALLMNMHALADRLGKTIGEIGKMSVDDFHATLAFHQVRKEEETGRRDAP